MIQPEILRDLGDGLILRRSTPADAERLADFNAHVHGNPDQNILEERAATWTRDLLIRPHPTFQPDDFTIVEDTRRGMIVSSLNLISQTWTYAGIPFGVGRVELVGTHPEYRNRGLVRHQFDVVHRWSAERGEVLQAITGIPYYYRQFGYEMALDLGGGRTGFPAFLPRLEEGQAEPYSIRPANEADLDFISSLYETGCRRSLVSCVRDQAMWQYELDGKSPDSDMHTELRVIETPEGERVGALAHPSFRWWTMMGLTWYEIIEGLSWAAVTPSVMRYLQTTGETYQPVHGQMPFGAITFSLGAGHPVYQVARDRLPRIRRPYAWYLRLPDLPGFIRRVAPALENHLSASAMTGYSGELKVTFYRTGLRLTFEKGRLTQAEAWQPQPQWNFGDAGFPGLTFLQLLFGYRGLDELQNAFADCWTENDDVYALLNALFPRQASSVWPVA